MAAWFEADEVPAGLARRIGGVAGRGVLAGPRARRPGAGAGAHGQLGGWRRRTCAPTSRAGSPTTSSGTPASPASSARGSCCAHSGRCRRRSRCASPGWSRARRGRTTSGCARWPGAGGARRSCCWPPPRSGHTRHASAPVDLELGGAGGPGRLRRWRPAGRDGDRLRGGRRPVPDPRQRRLRPHAAGDAGLRRRRTPPRRPPARDGARRRRGRPPAGSAPAGGIVRRDARPVRRAGRGLRHLVEQQGARCGRTAAAAHRRGLRSAPLRAVAGTGKPEARTLALRALHGTGLADQQTWAVERAGEDLEPPP